MLKLFDSETYGDNETLGIQTLQNKKYSEQKWGNLTPKGVRVGQGPSPLLKTCTKEL